MKIQKEFIPIVKEAAEECKSYFKDRFRTAYLHGSIALNDAVPYVSDLDYYIAVSEAPNKDDKDYFNSLEARLQEKYPIVNGVHLNIHSVEEVKADKFARFILRYNSTVYCGADIVKQLEESGCERILPDADTAKSRLSFARQCFSDALSGKQPANTGDIPSDTFYAARKFARYFVIIEGAYFLMTAGRFTSFEKSAVLSGLRKELQNTLAGLDSIIDTTERVLYEPVKANIPHDEYLRIIKPFMSRIFEYIENCR